MEGNMSSIIGIDLGSTNSLVSYWDGEKVVIVPNAFGDNLIPFVVGLDGNNQVFTSVEAKGRLITHLHKTAAFE
jgi:molecular chaperone HscC